MMGKHVGVGGETRPGTAVWRRVRLAWAIVPLLAAATGLTLSITAAMAEQSSAPSLVAINIHEGASLGEAMTALADATGFVIVADATRTQPTLSTALDNVPLDEALARISVDFDRYWVRRGRAIALQARRGDPEEPFPLEMEELQSIATDLTRIVSLVPVPASPLDFDYPRMKAAFVSSLTAAQQRAMITKDSAPKPWEGLPFADLTPDQQRLLMGINLLHVYQDATTALRNAAAAVLQIERVDVIANVQDQRGLGEGVAAPSSLGVRFVDRSGRQRGLGGYLLTTPRRTATSMPEPEGEERPSTIVANGVTRWRRPVRAMTLEEFASEWQRAIGKPLLIPAYATERRFWICSGGASRTEAVQALADLWGWETRSAARGRVLGRPSFAPAADAGELHTEALRATPPALLHAARLTHSRREWRRRAWELRHLHIAAVAAVGANEPFPSARLTDEDRRRLAHAVLEWALFDWYSMSDRLGGGRPPRYITAPETVVLTLSGPLNDAALPLLWMRTLGPTGAQTSGWGFTARLKWPPEKHQ